MYSEYQSKNNPKEGNYIPDRIQNEVIQEYSRKFLEDEFESVKEAHGEKAENEKLSKADKLYNLISGLGQIFHKIYVSDKTERVVFSVALYDSPDKELSEIIELAERYGYLHRSSIGNKHGTGRSKQYILSRTLAPYFKLDPSGFKGYRFMKSEVLKIALSDPNKFEKVVNKNIMDEDENNQLNIFDKLD